MGLETGSFISDLNSANPPGGDDFNQGDDHLRLLKTAVKGSFPNSSRAFYLPVMQVEITVATALVNTQENEVVLGNTSGGSFTVTLPSGAGLPLGWQVTVVKNDASNILTVDGFGVETINAALTSDLTALYDAETYVWDGSEWYIIASTFDADAPVFTTELQLDGIAPVLKLRETDGTATHNMTGLLQDSDLFTIQTRTNTGAVVASDYIITKGAGGSTEHEWRISDAEALLLDSSNRLILGGRVSGPLPSLAGMLISSGDSGRDNADNDADELVLEGSSAEVGLSIIGGATSLGNIYFGDPADPNEGQIVYNHGDDSLKIFTGSQKRLTISATTGPLESQLDTAQATTSGSQFNFTSPFATTVKVEVLFKGVSLVSAQNLLVQLGDAGGIEASGYLSAGGNTGNEKTASNGLIISTNSSAAATTSGIYTAEQIDGCALVVSVAVANASTNSSSGGGHKTLSAALTQIRVTSTGGVNFDAGKVNVRWWGIS